MDYEAMRIREERLRGALQAVSTTTSRGGDGLSASVGLSWQSSRDALIRFHEAELAELRTTHAEEIQQLQETVYELERQLKEAGLVREAELERVRSAGDKAIQALELENARALRQLEQQLREDFEQRIKAVTEAEHHRLATFEQSAVEHSSLVQRVVLELEDQLDQAKEDAASQQGRAEASQTEMTGLKRDLAYAHDALKSRDAMIHKLGIELERAQRDPRLLVDTTALNAKLKGAQEQEEMLRAALARLRREKTQLATRTDEEHNLALSAMRQELTALRTHLTTAEQNAQHARKKLAAAEAELKIEKEARVDLEGQRSRQPSEHDLAELARLRRKLANTTAQLADYKRRFEQAETEAQSQERAHQKALAAAHNEREKVLRQLAVRLKKEFQDRIDGREATWREELDVLNLALSELSNKHQTDMIRTREACAAQVQQLQNDLSAARRRHSEETESLRQRVSELELQLSRAEETRRRQLMELGAAREEELHGLRLKYEQQVHDLRQEAERGLRQARAHHEAEVAATVERALSRVEVSHKHSISALSDQLEQCRRQLNSADETSPARAEAERLRQALQKTKAELITEQETRQRDAADAATQLRKMKEEQEGLQAMHQHELSKLTIAHEEALSLRMEQGLQVELEATINALREQVLVLEDQLNEHRRRA